MDTSFMLNAIAWAILAGAFSVFVWRTIAARRLRPAFLLFLLLPGSQLIMLYSFTYDTQTIYWLISMFFGLGANFALLAYTVSQESKTALEEEIRETRHLLELEQAHYAQVEERREELAKIRSDFNARLGTAAALVRTGKDDAAGNMITALSEKINNTKENPYCNIPVVNAILTQKAQECAAANIRLSIDLHFPAALDIAPMHLCSIFGNLMDNAITACKNIDNGTSPAIRLSSLAHGDYLFIKTVNTSPQPAKNPKTGRGYGSRILEDIAAIYSGGCQAGYNNGCFTAVVSLLAVPEERKSL